jgi:hypothetical protein
MSDQWQYQLRIYLTDQLAEVARRDPAASALGLLPRVLEKHSATGAVNLMPDRQSCRCASSKPAEINPTALSLSHRAK